MLPLTSVETDVLYIYICCFIITITFLQVINYGDIWPQIFCGHDLDLLGSRDIHFATRVFYGWSMMTMHGYVDIGQRIFWATYTIVYYYAY